MNSEDTGPCKQRTRRRRILEPGASPSSEGPFNSPVTKRKRTPLSTGEQDIIVNIYKFVKNTWPSDSFPSNQKMIEKTSDISGVSKRSIYRILGTYRDTHNVSEEELQKRTKMPNIDNLDSFTSDNTILGL